MPTPTSSVTRQELIDALTRDPLRNVVLLKHLLAYPQHVRIHRVEGGEGSASLVVLDTTASPYDRQTYPQAALAALIASDHPALTARLLDHVPHGVGVVFKLASAADRAAVEARFAIERRTAFLSFTVSAAAKAEPLSEVRLTATPGDDALAMFETQGHARTWLAPLLRDGRAFTCVLERGGETLAACLAFETFGPVWEVGGVVTAPAYRRQGLGAKVVSTALAALAEQRLTPRYQVEEHNTASIALARSVGLTPFLTLEHWIHATDQVRPAAHSI